MKRFVLLDRDGTIIIEKNYLSTPDDIEFIPGSIEALRKLRNLGFGLLVITNQSGIGRNYFDLTTLNKIHKKMTDMLFEHGVLLDDIYFCPHTPEDNCSCRKPKAGLVEKAIKKHNFSSSMSFVIGDNKQDIELGRNIGAITILVKTGYGAKVAKERLVTPDYIVDNLYSGAVILERKFRK